MPKTYTGKDIAIGFDMKRCIHAACFSSMARACVATCPAFA